MFDKCDVPLTRYEGSWPPPQGSAGSALNPSNRHQTKPVGRPTTSADATEFAWRVHDSIGDWTARVDTKASIALAIEAAVLGFVVTLAIGDGALTEAKGWIAALVLAGTIALVISVTLSVLVVFPQLRGRRSRKEYQNNFVYFGHLRHWRPVELQKRLAANPVRLDQLSRQLVNMSKIVWRKHVWLQWSLALFIGGVLLIGGALVKGSTFADSAPGSGYRATIPYDQTGDIA